MKIKEISIKKHAILTSIIPGLLWFVIGFQDLVTKDFIFCKQIEILIGVLLVTLMIFFILGLVKKREFSDELVEEHENKSKMFSYQISLLILLIAAVILDIPALRISLSVRATLSFVAGIMYLLKGFSFLFYEKENFTSDDDVLLSEETKKC